MSKKIESVMIMYNDSSFGCNVTYKSNESKVHTKSYRSREVLPKNVTDFMSQATRVVKRKTANGRFFSEYYSNEESRLVDE